MTLEQIFIRYIGKPIEKTPFEKSKVPFLNSMEEVFTRHNPLWTAVAGVAALALGLSAFALVGPLMALWAAPLIAVSAFGLTMAAFDKAKIGPYKSLPNKARRAAQDAANYLAQRSESTRRTLGLTTQKEDRRKELTDTAEAVLEAADEAADTVYAKASQGAYWCSDKASSCFNWSKSLVCSAAEDDAAAKPTRKRKTVSV